MTAKEAKLIGLGAGAGMLVIALAVGLIAVRGTRIFAGESNPDGAPSPSAQATRNTKPLDTDTGTLPGTTVELSPAEITAAGVQLADVQTAMLKTDIDAFGRVEQPEAQLAAVSARIGGRVDKLYVQYTGEKVKSGQPVADIYSPEVSPKKIATAFANPTMPTRRPRPTHWSKRAGTGSNSGASPASRWMLPPPRAFLTSRYSRMPRARWLIAR